MLQDRVKTEAGRWLVNCWQVAAHAHEVERALLARTINEEPVVFYRTPTGEVVAFEDRCPHRGLPLSLGRLLESSLQCGYHGLRYDAAGTCIGVPGQDAIPAAAKLRGYPIVERDRLVWIWMGDPAQADPASVPDVHWNDDAGWVCARGYHYVRANYQLLTDNLLDLSHESFVHEETIGNRAVADSPATAKLVEDREVQVYRLMQNCPAPPMYVSANGLSGTIDRWHTTIYAPPGYCLIKNGAKPSGSNDPAAVTERRIINLITPETATSSHYFWSIARGYGLDDDDLTEHLRKATCFTFDQDARVLEAQQRSLGPSMDPVFPVSIRLDAGPTMARRLLKSAIAREAAAPH